MIRRYPRELVETPGGGQFLAISDWCGLADMLMTLACDRTRIREFVPSARALRLLYDRDATMLRRIDLIKENGRPTPSRRLRTLGSSRGARGLTQTRVNKLLQREE